MLGMKSQRPPCPHIPQLIWPLPSQTPWLTLPPSPNPASFSQLCVLLFSYHCLCSYFICLITPLIPPGGLFCCSRCQRPYLPCSLLCLYSQSCPGGTKCIQVERLSGELTALACLWLRLLKGFCSHLGLRSTRISNLYLCIILMSTNALNTFRRQASIRQGMPIMPKGCFRDGPTISTRLLIQKRPEL